MIITTYIETCFLNSSFLTKWFFLFDGSKLIPDDFRSEMTFGISVRYWFNISDSLSERYFRFLPKVPQTDNILSDHKHAV